MKRNKRILTCLYSSLMLLAACSDNEVVGSIDNDGLDENGLATVNIEVKVTENVNSTRAVSQKISSGSKIDMLIYAVYDVTNGIDNATPINYYQANYGTSSAGQGDNYSAINLKPQAIPAGQTYVGYNADDTYSLVMKIDPNKKYRIVFWAQDSRCNAYDTKDLTAIKVNYSGAANNDESRDAFSKVSDEITAKSRGIIKVELRRPLSQINIGTTGADYANLIYDPLLLPHGIVINQSKIKVTGVADTYNALTGSATAAGNNQITAEFAYSNLPAWLFSKMPDFSDSYTKETNPFIKHDGEEFLKVELNKDDIIEGYLTDYPTMEKETNKYLTETFKYLSMCYVLTPTTDESGSIVSVAYNLQQFKEGKATYLIERNLTQVPVKANYRTNIVGGLSSKAKDSNDPDPSSIFNFMQLPIVIMSDFKDNQTVPYFTATLEVKREDYRNDGLKINKVINPTKTEAENIPSDGKTITIPSIFTGSSVAYDIYVNEGFDVLIDSNVSNENDLTVWSQSDLTEVENEEGRMMKRLIISSRATAGVFKITISPIQDNEDEV